MNINNNATKMRRTLLVHVIKKFFNDTLNKDLDQVPVKLAPKYSENSVRCCVYKDRALLKYRIMNLLGVRYDEEVDETKLLREYADDALLGKNKDHKELFSVLQLACKSCATNRYFITNACQGCFARPCQTNCPTNAISFFNNQAVIDPQKCVNCGKCEKECTYRAISHIPVPCEDSCPVGAISKLDDGSVKLDDSKCIYCGKCYANCPFGAIVEKTNIIDILKCISDENKDAIAIVAPSIIGQFSSGADSLSTALKTCGFSKMYEVAQGADLTIKNEAIELEQSDKMLTTSCCPSYIALVDKHIPDLKKYVSHTKTPMEYTAEIVKKDHPDSTVIFIGPCLAKKNEARNSNTVDYTMTFEEVGALFIAKDVQVMEQKKERLTIIPSHDAQGFAEAGGVTKAVLNKANLFRQITTTQFDGVTKKDVNKLKLYANGKIKSDFIEVMSCESGCVGGPFTITSPQTSKKRMALINKSKEKS